MKLEMMKEVWKQAFDEMNSTPAFQRIASGDIEIKHYQAVMRQIFHHARENPQIQALATVYFRGDQRAMVKMFYKHASQEIGHDQLALNDLAATGHDVSEIPTERPLPATTALIAYPFFQIQQRDPIGYLGYLFFLEYTPVQGGKTYQSLFEKIGVPSTALTFIEEHATVDVAHNKMMERYIDSLIRTQEDLDEVLYAIRVTARLYSRMVAEAFSQADIPQVWGVAETERREVRNIKVNHSEAPLEAVA